MIRKHYVAILFSLLVGLMIIGPQIWFIKSLGSDYHGIYMMNADAEPHYIARMQEAIENGSFGNPFIYEYKDNVPSATYTVSETILAWPAKLFGFSIPNLSLFYKFLLPAIIAILVYSLTYRLIGNRLWSIASMLAVTLGHSLVNYPDLIHFLRWENVYSQFSLYSRPVNPEFSSILFFTYLHVMLLASRKKTWIWFIILGILFGFSFYVYFYSYTFFLALNFVAFCLYLVRKEKEVFIKIFSATVIGVIIGGLSIFNTIRLYGHSYFKEMSELSGITSSHYPILSVAGVIVVALFLIFIFKNKNYPDIVFLGALLITAFVVINQQVITGILIQEGHYHWYFNTPIFIIIFIYLLFSVTNHKHKYIGLLLAILICTVSFADSFLIQSSSYQNSFVKTKSNQRYVEILLWLAKEAPKDSVVLANKTLSELIPAYTSANVVWEEHASYYLLPKERRDFTPENILKDPDIEKAISAYRVDYLVWDSLSEPDWSLNLYPFLHLVYDNNGIKIYAR